jgi:hypothetical protein
MRGAGAGLLAALLALQCAALSAQEPVGEQVSLLLIGGKRAGTSRQSVRVLSDGTWQTEVSVRMAVRRFGNDFTIVQHSTWLEDGLWRSVEAETELNGQRESLSARLEGGGIQVVQERQGRHSESRIAASGDLLGPHGLSERVARAIAGSERELTVLRFQPETAALETLRLTLLGPGDLRDSLGGLHRGFLAEEESSVLPGIVSRAIYDERGEQLYSVAEVGLKMEQVRIEEGDGGAGGELELFDVSSLVLPVRWPAAGPPPLGRLEAVSLRFTGAALPELERAAEAALADLGGRGYRLSRDGEGLILRIERPGPPPVLPVTPSPSAASAPAGSTPPAAGQYTGDGFYLDLTDPRLGELLARCPERDLGCLEALVDSFIRDKSLRYGFSAVAEILDTKAGDCTEHALLLAALLRRSGLASRLAYGFLLTESGFIGHAWTEVYAGGRWVWLDPSFPAGRPYGFRLRLGLLDPALPVWQQMGASLLSLSGTVRAELLEAVREP